MTEDSGSLLAMQKLNGDNYANWAFRVKNCLKYKKLWKCVIEEKVDPESDEQALSIISLSCNDIVKDLISECTTAKEAWKILEVHYVRKTPAAKVGLYCELTSIKCDNLAGVRDLMDRFSIIVRKLRDLKVNMDNDMYSIVLLRALPPSFEQFKVAIMTRDALPELDEVKAKVEEERFRQLQNEPVADLVAEQALLARRHFAGNRNNNIGVVRGDCFQCGKSGHFKRDCPMNRYRPQHQSAFRNDRREPDGNYKQALITTVMSATETNTADLISQNWVIDSGCTTHICRSRCSFAEFRDHRTEVELPDGSRIYSRGVGKVEIPTPQCVMDLHEVQYIPEFKTNLFSVQRADERGCEVTFAGGRVVIKRDSQVIGRGRKVDNDLYVIDQKVCGSEVAMNINSIGQSLSLMEWHRRLGHLNLDAIVNMSKNELVSGLHLNSTRRISCEVCARSKIAEETFPAVTHNRAQERIIRIHSDVCEMPVRSFGGAKYFVTFIDDYSRYMRVSCIKSKSEVFSCWQSYKALVENQCGTNIKVLRSDNGGEYKSKEFSAHLKECGIIHETTVPESPSQNGVAERANRVLTEMVRCMILDGGMPSAAWAEAIQSAAYIRNRAASSATPAATPFELMYGRKPTMGHIRRFGAKAVALKRGRDMNKLRPKGDVLRFSGYSPTQKGYRLVDINSGSLTVSRNVRFLDDLSNEVVQVDEEHELIPGTSQNAGPDDDAEKFEDCSSPREEQREEQLEQPRERYDRAVKVPQSYKDLSSDDEEW